MKAETLIDHMQAVERAVSQDKGPFTLFALFEREDLSERWDLVACAPWLKPRREDILTITLAMSQHLEPSEMVLIARVVPVPEDSDFVQNVLHDLARRTVTGGGVDYSVLDWPHMSGEDWRGRGYVLTPKVKAEMTQPVGAAA